MGVRNIIILTICLTLIIFNIEVYSQASVVTTPPFFAQRYAGIPRPRGLMVDRSGDVLVLSEASAIYALTETSNNDGSVTILQNMIVNGAGLGLNHGITFNQGFIYASSQRTVYRWPYVPGNRTLVTAQAQTVISTMPPGGHVSRTLIFDKQGKLYVSVGSNANIDPNSDRARIRRFDLTLGFPVGGITFTNGEVFADGLRNEVGMDFDLNGTLWGVENGADMLSRPDFGGDIHNGNPAEDLNRFDREIGTHYGYPYCFSTYNLPQYTAGTQFAWPTFMNDGVHTDAWCQNPANNQPPILAMQAHTAPLGINFYDGRGCGIKEGALPCSATGDAFIAFHGSWNSDIKVGYRVGWLPFNKTTLEPTGEIISVIYNRNTATCGNACFRPVNAVFDLDGHLIVSSDDTSEIFRIYYGTPPPPITT